MSSSVSTGFDVELFSRPWVAAAQSSDGSPEDGTVDGDAHDERIDRGGAAAIRLELTDLRRARSALAECRCTPTLTMRYAGPVHGCFVISAPDHRRSRAEDPI